MIEDLPKLPVTEVVPALLSALDGHPNAVLAAPPGAGKTTLVPLHLLSADWLGEGRILVLEPRRLAARAGARQMARLIGEDVGGTVGYRTRLDTRITTRTRIEVITEGIFTRMVLDDPDLPGIAAVLFDEFHERTLESDFGLALALDVQSGLRDDLRLVVMSATLDVARVATLLEGAPVIESTGRSYPVEIRYDARPAGERIEHTMANAIRSVLESEDGSILGFLPGQAEIKRTAALLENTLPDGTVLTMLYGDLPGGAQDAAIQPAKAGTRKIVLATAIAETSITIDGVRIVIDSGLQRLPVFEPSTGITRLETVRASRASADQRAGRAGRTEPGIALRLWREEQNLSLPAFTPPQIKASDLSGLLLDCAAWGVSDPTTLRFIDPPPDAALSEATELLRRLTAMDDHGHLTSTGKKMRSLGLPVRLAAMVIAAAGSGQGVAAAQLAVLIGEKGLGGPSIDLDARLQNFRRDKGGRAKKAQSLTDRLIRTLKISPGDDPDDGAQPAGALLLHGFSDRVAKRQGSTDHGQRRYRLANGRGAFVDEHDALAREPFLVVCDLTGNPQSQRILAAAPVDLETLLHDLAREITEQDAITFDSTTKRVRARRQQKLGSLVLVESELANPGDEAIVQALCSGVRGAGLAVLPWNAKSRQLRDRLDWLHRTLKNSWPDMSDGALLSGLETWFAPFQHGVKALARIEPSSLSDGLLSLVRYDLQRDLDRLAPTHFQTPAGSNLPIRYDGEVPVLSVRVQELFGLEQHPVIGDGAQPLLLELLSPAQRPIQTTRDLPGFWAGSWADVRGEMRGRYPKHPWPDDPAAADATRRVKYPKKR
ncbi:MAG: ATP-dependent helicase HrpB [Alphaproteobacteria bacterium]|nr:ATP-dependent helicase HrpB [Alphaproteobacteria bacterium]